MGILAAATLAASIPHQLTLILYFNNLEKVNVGQAVVLGMLSFAIIEFMVTQSMQPVTGSASAMSLVAGCRRALIEYVI